ncbi:MAG: hypothetical protein ACTS5I_04695 [Rhodanobacter sp.]
MRDESKEAHAALEAWSRWAKSYLNGLGFATTSIIARCMKQGALGHSGYFGPVPMEIDRTCEVVDRAISRLDATERRVIYQTYLGNDAAQITAQKCGLTYGYYREVLKDARRRIGDYINGAKFSVVSPTGRVLP